MTSKVSCIIHEICLWEKNIPFSQSIRNVFLISIVYIIYMSIYIIAAVLKYVLFSTTLFFWGVKLSVF